MFSINQHWYNFGKNTFPPSLKTRAGTGKNITNFESGWQSYRESGTKLLATKTLLEI